jgi:hypothetical protein
VAKIAFMKKKALFTSKMDLNFRKNCYFWSRDLCGAGSWILRKGDKEYLVSFEMWCNRRMEKISWTDHVRNEEVLQRGE